MEVGREKGIQLEPMVKILSASIQEHQIRKNFLANGLKLE
jgi:hypothetical protein